MSHYHDLGTARNKVLALQLPQSSSETAARMLEHLALDQQKLRNYPKQGWSKQLHHQQVFDRAHNKQNWDTTYSSHTKTRSNQLNSFATKIN
jgi:hypothetical protein